MKNEKNVLDEYLDSIVTTRRVSPNGPRLELRENCDLLHRRLPAVQPDGGFASALRSSLFGDVVLPSAERSEQQQSVVAVPKVDQPVSIARRSMEIAAVLLLFAFVMYAVAQLRPNEFSDDTSIPSALNDSGEAALSTTEPAEITSGFFRNLTRIGGEYEINVGIAQLREGPSFDAPTLMQLKGGERVQLTALLSDFDVNEPMFFKVATDDGQSGWVWSEVLVITREELATQSVLTPSSQIGGAMVGEIDIMPTAVPFYQSVDQLTIVRFTSLREEPGSSGNALAELQAGERVWSKGRQIAVNGNNWIAVEYQGMGRTLWIEASALAYPNGNPVPGVASVASPINGPGVQVYLSGASTKGVTIVPGVMAKGMTVEVVFDVEIKEKPSAQSTTVKLAPTGLRLLVTGESILGTTNSSWVPVLDPSSGDSGWVPLAWIQTPEDELKHLFPGQRIELNEGFELYAGDSTDSGAFGWLRPRSIVVITSTAKADGNAMWVQFVVPGAESVTAWIKIEGFSFKEATPIATP